MDDFGTKIIGVFFVVVVCLLVIIGIDVLELQELRNTNEQLKKENYEYKQEIKKCKNEKLNMIIKGDEK